MADAIEPRMAVLEQIARSTDQRLDRIEKRIDALGSEIRGDLREIRSNQRSDFRWFMTLYIAGMATLLGVMAHGFHWL